jgi:hypothetical protein
LGRARLEGSGKPDQLSADGFASRGSGALVIDRFDPDGAAEHDEEPIRYDTGLVDDGSLGKANRELVELSIAFRERQVGIGTQADSSFLADGSLIVGGSAGI